MPIRKMIDWNKWGTPTVVLLIIGFILTWIRPAVASALHFLLRQEPSRAVETGMAVWKSEPGKLAMKDYLEDLLADKWKVSDQALAIARANQDSLTQVVFTQEALSLSFKEIQASVKDIPSLDESLTRLSKSVEEFALHMAKVSDFMSRSDERERVRAEYDRGIREERRHHQQDPSPRNRTSDGS